MSPRITLSLTLGVALGITTACGRPPGVPDSPSNSQNSQTLPFDRQPPPTTATSHSLIPPATLPEGTFLTVRLSKPLSSASARAGDSFEGALDDPVIVDHETLLPRGATVSGRVLDVRRFASLQSPGYLRITLVSVTSSGKTFLIDTSSIFAKAAQRPSPSGAIKPASGDVNFSPDRRLTFRLAQAVDLQ